MRYVIYFGIPVVLLVLGAVGRWVMAGGEWNPEFGCLGPDLLLGSLGAETAFLADVGRQLLASSSTSVPADVGRRIVFCTLAVVVTFVLLVLAWLSHRSPRPRRGRAISPVRPWTGWRLFGCSGSGT